jgi:hypothetical protein
MFSWRLRSLRVSFVIAKLCLVAIAFVFGMVGRAEADNKRHDCRASLATLVSMIDAKPQTDLAQIAPNGDLNIMLRTAAGGYEIGFHCNAQSQWVTVQYDGRLPTNDWFNTVVQVGSIAQDWKPETLESAARRCHHDALISTTGYRSPSGLECWVNDKRSMIAVWPQNAN